MIGPLRNPVNWRNATNTLRIIANPLTFFMYLLLPVWHPLIRVRTPTGIIKLRVRNRESAKTIFSVFCREDYHLLEARAIFLDLGSNIGVAAAYFLSRHCGSKVIGVEPDPNNVPYLAENMRQFASRFEHRAVAAHTASGSIDFYCSQDGKYSTTVEQNRSKGWHHIEVPCTKFADLCREATTAAEGLPVIVKIDVEGLETTLVKSIDFSQFPAIKRLIIESTECSELIRRKHVRTVRNGYIEDLVFG